jgi:hypothetical protein
VLQLSGDDLLPYDRLQHIAVMRVVDRPVDDRPQLGENLARHIRGVEVMQHEPLEQAQQRGPHSLHLRPLGRNLPRNRPPEQHQLTDHVLVGPSHVGGEDGLALTQPLHVLSGSLPLVHQFRTLLGPVLGVEVPVLEGALYAVVSSAGLHPLPLGLGEQGARLVQRDGTGRLSVPPGRFHVEADLPEELIHGGVHLDAIHRRLRTGLHIADAAIAEVPLAGFAGLAARFDRARHHGSPAKTAAQQPLQ